MWVSGSLQERIQPSAGSAGSPRCSGDGGNRTRVREVSTEDLYRLSRLLVLADRSPVDGGSTIRQPLEPESPSFARLAASRAAPRHCGARPSPGQRREEADVASAGGQTLSRAVRLRGAGSRKCDWHLKVCADFARSAPLGLPSGASRFRRSLSSP